MRVVFAGTPEVAVVSLEAVLASRHEVVAVVTRPDAVAGRGRRLTPSPVSRAASERAIPVLTPTKPSDPEFVQTL
ncbi:MAG TPA: methionyl-tRNA formyltransferase, partial [Actinomycetota bacterium]|nr:methionyl-tRNA formyltransferase [Actinomycetota bacterium]